MIFSLGPQSASMEKSRVSPRTIVKNDDNFCVCLPFFSFLFSSFLIAMNHFSALGVSLINLASIFAREKALQGNVSDFFLLLGKGEKRHG